ncbi:MAG TPA: hypothetical protein ENK18_22000 [Deltaproteobacteria bacterium]|nr:hypothetical protein [Deltaproteobacteria bacterium]
MNPLSLLAALSTSALGQQTDACEHIKLRELVSDPGPGVLFLGERHGVRKDLSRAYRIVNKLSHLGPVTLGLEAVPAAQQSVLDRLSLGRLPFETLPEALDWDNDWGYSFSTYERLLKLYDRDEITLVGVGQPLQLRPEEASVPLPPGYAMVLADTMGDGPIPVELESRLVQTVAWHDHRIATSALEGWGGRGWLVVVVDRNWLEGGLGVAWQATRLTEAPVSAALLADAGTRCYRGDRVIK